MLVDINYNRVLPRDLFNESKLLKCIGRLCLFIHNNEVPFTMSIEETSEPFKIGLTEDGHLTITNLDILIDNTSVQFKTVYNSQSPYPLIASFHYEECLVFDDNGEFTEEFVEFRNLTVMKDHEFDPAGSNSKQIKCPGCREGIYCNAYYCKTCERCWKHHKQGE